MRATGLLREGHQLPGSARPSRITEKEFADLRELIHRESGICLSAAKVDLLVNRLSPRLRELGLPSFGEYYRHVTGGADSGEKMRMLDRISTKETHFFREPRHFQFLEEMVLREPEGPSGGRRPRCLRAWSSACSTGEEPYSLGMVLRAKLPAASGWEVRILATDLSTSALEKARNAIYPLERSREIPLQHLHAFMLKGTESRRGWMRVGDEIRSLVEFRPLNLNDAEYAADGPFDLIFCRNVLIYFDPETRRRVVDRLLRHLHPEGYLFVGSAESLGGLTDAVRPVLPAVYVHAGAPGGAGPAIRNPDRDKAGGLT